MRASTDTTKTPRTDAAELEYQQWNEYAKQYGHLPEAMEQAPNEANPFDIARKLERELAEIAPNIDDDALASEIEVVIAEGWAKSLGTQRIWYTGNGDMQIRLRDEAEARHLIKLLRRIQLRMQPTRRGK